MYSHPIDKEGWHCIILTAHKIFYLQNCVRPLSAIESGRTQFYICFFCFFSCHARKEEKNNIVSIASHYE